MTLAGTLTEWRRRGDGVRGSVAGAKIVCGLVVALALPPAVGWAPRVIGFILVSISAVAAVWYARPSLADLAREVDAAGTTGGLLATALAVQRGDATGANDLQEAVLADAMSQTEALAPLAMPRWRAPWRWVGVAALTLALGTIPRTETGRVWAAQVGVPAALIQPAATDTPPTAARTGSRTITATDASQTHGARGARGDRAEGAVGRGGLEGVPGSKGESGLGSSAEAGGGLADAAGSEAAAEAPEDPYADPRLDGAVNGFAPTPQTGRANGKESLVDLYDPRDGTAGAPDEDDVFDEDHDPGTEEGDPTGEAGADDPTMKPGEKSGGGATQPPPDGKTREGSGQGEATATDKDSPMGAAPDAGDARSKDDNEKAAGPGGASGSDATGAAEAMEEQLRALRVDLAKEQVEAAWVGGGQGTLREVEQAALGQRSNAQWQTLQSAYREIAEDAVQQDAVPATRRTLVRRYFDAISTEDADDLPAD